MTVRLLALSGPLAGTHYSLEAPIRIGSGPECELRISDPKIAPLHATISSDGRHDFILEAHSLLYVDAEAVRRIELANPSQIDIGDSTLLFEGGTNHMEPPRRVERWPEAPPLTAPSPLVPVATLELARANPALVGLDAHRLLVVGGLSPLGNTPLDSAELVDVRSGKTQRIPLCEARQHPVALRLRDGRVFIAGGSSGAEVLTPQGSVPCKARARVARQGASAAELPDGRVLIVGGYPSSASTPSMELYDPQRDAFESLEAPALPQARTAQVGQMLLISASTPVPSRLFSFNLRTLELHQLPAPPLADGLIDGLAALADGRFWIRASSTASRRAAFLFDPTTAVMSSAAPVLAARSDFVGAVTEDGRLLVTGGSSVSKGRSSAELYDPARDAWDALPALRMGIGSTAVAVGLPQGPVVIVDGARLFAFDVHWAARAPRPVLPPPPPFVEPLDRFQVGDARTYARVLANLEGRETLDRRSQEEFPTTPITDAEVVEVLGLGLKARTLRAALQCAKTLALAKALPELATPPLLEALAHPAEAVRSRAVISLSELAPLPDAAVSEVITRLMSESRASVRTAMVALLARHVSQRSGDAHQVLTSVLTHLAHGEPDPVLTAAKSGWSFAAHGQGVQPERHEGQIGEVAQALATLPAHPLDFPYLVPLLEADNLFIRKSAEALLARLAGMPTMRESIIECLRPLVANHDARDYGRAARLAAILDELGAKEELVQLVESNADDHTVVQVLTLLAAHDDGDGGIARGLDRLQTKHPAHTKVGAAVRAARSKRGLSVDDGRVGVPLAERLVLYRPLDLPLASDLFVSRGLVFAGVMQSDPRRPGLSLPEARCGVVVIDPERELSCRTFRLPLRFAAADAQASVARRLWQIAAVTADGLLMMMDQPFSREGSWGREQYLYEWLLKDHSWRRWRRVSDAWHQDVLSPAEAEEAPANRVSVGELRVWQAAAGAEVFAHVDSTPTFLEDAVSPDGTLEAVRAEAEFRGKTFEPGRRSSDALAWDIDGLPPLLDFETAVRAHELRAEPGARVILLTSLSYRAPSGAFVRLAFCRSGADYDGVARLR